MNPCLEAALQYLHLGWSAIPIRARGDTENRKRPLLESWEPYQHQRPTEEEVRSWWALWPDANADGGAA